MGCLHDEARTDGDADFDKMIEELYRRDQINDSVSADTPAVPTAPHPSTPTTTTAPQSNFDDCNDVLNATTSSPAADSFSTVGWKFY